MKLINRRRFAFIGKSLLWSLLLYVVMMVAFDWDDVRNSVSGNNNITVVKPSLPETPTTGVSAPLSSPPAITSHAGVIKSIIAVFKVISGISNH